jgi:hypothetical protein
MIQINVINVHIKKKYVERKEKIHKRNIDTRLKVNTRTE